MKETVTDEEAVELLKSTAGGRAQPGDVFATRTIMYPVLIERKPGIKTPEIRPYVIMRQYYNERHWKKALDVEKRYAGLNKVYREGLKAKGLPTDAKEIPNPLNTYELEFK